MGLDTSYNNISEVLSLLQKYKQSNILIFLLNMLILPEFLNSGFKLSQSRVVERKKDFMVISNRQLGIT
jgi:hypothetical protein